MEKKYRLALICALAVLLLASPLQLQIRPVFAEGLAPFSLEALPGEVVLDPGGNAMFQVSVSSPVLPEQQVLLSLTDLPAGISAEITPNPVTQASPGEVVLTAEAGVVPGSYTLGLTGIGVEDQSSISVALKVRSPDFEIHATPETQTVAAGKSVVYQISVVGQGGFDDAVSLGLAGQPDDTQVSFQPGSLLPGESGTLTLTPAFATPAGAYTLTISGQAGEITHLVEVGTQVIRSDYLLDVEPSTLSVLPGSTAYIAIRTTAVNGYDWPITFSANGLPLGATAGFSPNPVLPGETATLTINIPAGTPSQVYPLSIQADSLAKQEKGLELTVAAPFTLRFDPSSVVIRPGKSAVYTLTLEGFNGFNSAASLSVGSLSGGISATLEPQVLSPGESAQLILQTQLDTPQTGYAVDISATSGQMHSSAPATLLVADTAATCGDWTDGYTFASGELNQTPLQIVSQADPLSPDDYPKLREGDQSVLITSATTAWDEFRPGSASGLGINGWISHNTNLYQILYWSMDIAVDSQGNPILAWTKRDTFDGLKTYVYIDRFDGTNWVEIGSGSASGNGLSSDTSADNIQVVVDALDRPMIAWGESGHIVVKRFEGSAWRGPLSGSTTGDILQGGGAIGELALDANDHPYLLANNQVFTTQAQNWVSLPSFGNVYSISNLALDSHGAVYVAWKGGWQGDLAIERYDGTGWSLLGNSTVPASGVSILNPTMAIDADDRVYLAWTDTYQWAIDLLRYDNGWEEIPAGSAHGSGISQLDEAQEPRLSIDPAGRVHLLWISGVHGPSRVAGRIFNGTSWMTAGTGGLPILNPSQLGAGRMPTVISPQAGGTIATWVSGYTDPVSKDTWLVTYVRQLRPAYAMQVYRFHIPQGQDTSLHPQVSGSASGAAIPGVVAEIWNTLTHAWEEIGSSADPELGIAQTLEPAAYLDAQRNVYLRVRSAAPGSLETPVKLSVDRVSLVLGDLSETPLAVPNQPWSEIVTLPTGFYNNYSPAIAFDQNNLGHLLYQGAGIGYIRLDGSGHEWLRRTVSEGDHGRFRLGDHSINFTPDGAAHMTWESYAYHGLGYGIVDLLGNVFHTFLIPGDAFENLAIYRAGDEMRIRGPVSCRVTFMGSLINCGGNDAQLSAQGKNGRVRLLAGAGSNFSSAVLLPGQDQPEKWVGVNFNGLPVDLQYSAGAEDSNGLLHVFYARCERAYCGSGDSASAHSWYLWHTAVDETGKVVVAPHHLLAGDLNVDWNFKFSAAIDSHNLAHLAWSRPNTDWVGGFPPYNFAIYHLAVDARGKLALPEEKVATSDISDYETSRPSLSIGGHDVVHIAWSEQSEYGREIHYRNFNACRGIAPVKVEGSGFSGDGNFTLDLCSPYPETTLVWASDQICSSGAQPYQTKVTVKTGTGEGASALHATLGSPPVEQTLFVRFGDPASNQSTMYALKVRVGGYKTYLPVLKQ